MYYEIHVKGHLSDRWGDWFGDLVIRNLENGEAVLTGSLPDQSAFLGVLNHFQALNIEVLSVVRRENTPPDSPKGE